MPDPETMETCSKCKLKPCLAVSHYDITSSMASSMLIIEVKKKVFVEEKLVEFLHRRHCKLTNMELHQDNEPAACIRDHAAFLAYDSDHEGEDYSDCCGPPNRQPKRSLSPIDIPISALVTKKRKQATVRRVTL